MFWRKRPKPWIKPPAILDYQRSFSDSLRHSVSTDVDEAKRIVARANQIVGESGLGPALASTLLEHVLAIMVKARRFREYVHFPAEDISGEKETDEAHRTETTRVNFSYRGNHYTLTFVDRGMSQWATDDSNTNGKVELIYRGHSVLGLDVSKDLSKEHSIWRWQNVFAFLPGSWMKDLIEMAAHIDEGERRRFEG